MPDVHVHVPEREVRVDLTPEFHIGAPEVHVEAPEIPAPVVTVENHLPQPPDVIVAAPEVRLELPPRTVRVETDDEGNRRYVSE